MTMTPTAEDRVMRRKLGAELRRLRGEEPQGNVSRRLGFTQASLSNYETGKREPTLFRAAKIAGAYGVTLDELIARVSS